MPKFAKQFTNFNYKKIRFPATISIICQNTKNIHFLLKKEVSAIIIKIGIYSIAVAMLFIL